MGIGMKRTVDIEHLVDSVVNICPARCFASSVAFFKNKSKFEPVIRDIVSNRGVHNSVMGLGTTTPSMDANILRRLRYFVALARNQGSSRSGLNFVKDHVDLFFGPTEELSGK